MIETRFFFGRVGRKKGRKEKKGRERRRQERGTKRVCYVLCVVLHVCVCEVGWYKWACNVYVHTLGEFIAKRKGGL